MYSSPIREGVSDEAFSRNAPDRVRMTDFESVRCLLTSLLLHWPYTPDQQCPSIALCGPTGNGKSHLVHSVIDPLHNAPAASSSVSATTFASHERNTSRRVHCVTPPFAAALAVRGSDGCTGLRRVLRRAIYESCCRDGAQARVKGESACVTHTILLVLDHLQCFLSTDEGGIEDGDASCDDDDLSHAALDGACSPQGPVLADLYAILRCNPPLFTTEEVSRLGLSSLVIVLLFSGHETQLPRLLTRHAIDVVVTLPTPTTAERRAFFGQQFMKASPAGASKVDKTALVEALALRTGGIIYAGLVQIANRVASFMADANSSKEGGDGKTHPFTATEKALADQGEDNVQDMMQRLVTVARDDDRQTTDAIATVVAQKLIKQFQASRSPAALEQKRSAGYVDVQVTRWSDVAGMAEVKATLQRLVTLPLRHKNMYRHFGVRPSTGVLLHGPPGTGKTMLARAMATELNASFVYLDLPELLQAEVGESERRLDKFFRAARERSPAVLFIDELQAAFGARYDTVDHRSKSQTTSSTPVTSHDARLVSHLLYKLDEIHNDEEHTLLFVGATNVLHLLDPLLLRPGRLDTVIEVHLPDDAAREQLLRHIICGEWATWLHLANMDRTAPDVKKAQRLIIAHFVEATAGMTGAEIRHALSVFALQLTRLVSNDQNSNEQRGRRSSEQRLCKAIWNILEQEVHNNYTEQDKVRTSKEQTCLRFALKSANLDRSEVKE